MPADAPFPDRLTPGPSVPTTALGDRVRAELRLRHCSPRTERAYVDWIRRYWLFCNRRDPAAFGAPQVEAFLSELATTHHKAPATQNQALAALLFLYRRVLHQDLPWLDELVRAPRPPHLPVVLSRAEVRAVLDQLQGTPRLMSLLLYGAGLRLLECCHLRIKDVDFDRNQITIRRGKGGKDRLVMLPAAAKAELRAHVERMGAQHQRDLTNAESPQPKAAARSAAAEVGDARRAAEPQTVAARDGLRPWRPKGGGLVELPTALAVKLPNAGRDGVWQWVFPATRHYLHPETGQLRRHHLHETVVQDAMRGAVRDFYYMSKTFGPGEELSGAGVSGPWFLLGGLLSLPFDIFSDVLFLPIDIGAWIAGCERPWSKQP